MQAIVQHRYGGPETWTCSERDRPTAADDEVVVEVRAAGIDRGTWHLMVGEPYVVRLGYGLRGPKQQVPGLDVAGVVVEVGSAVTRFAVGDEVLGVANGSLAEYTTASADKLSHKPSSLPFDQAAVVAISGMTAHQAVAKADVEQGDLVLITGASGGVGSYAVQLAARRGAAVTALASAAKRDMVLQLGAEEALDYRAVDLAAIERRWDVIIDIAGNTPLGVLRRRLADDGALVIVGGEHGGRLIGGIHRTLAAPVLSRFVRQQLSMLFSREHHTELEPVLELIEDDALTVPLDRVVALDRAPSAMQALIDGEVRGKIAVSLDDAR